jgi:hypothetical protein
MTSYSIKMIFAIQAKCCFRCAPARARRRFERDDFSVSRDDFSVSRDDFSVSHETNSLWCA